MEMFWKIVKSIKMLIKKVDFEDFAADGGRALANAAGVSNEEFAICLFSEQKFNPSLEICLLEKWRGFLSLDNWPIWTQKVSKEALRCELPTFLIGLTPL